MTDLAAAVYAEENFRIFPLRGKVPLIPKAAGGNGVLDATDDPDQIAEWWTKWPTANIGAAIPPTMCVVDVDPRHDGEVTWQRLSAGRQVHTATVLTGRMDGGKHLWLRKPDGPIRTTLGPGVDVKRWGGYVVLPPSIHPDTGMPYRWANPGTPVAVCPTWLAELLRVPVRPAAPPVATPGCWAADGVLRLMANAPVGERNRVLFWACCRAVEHHAGDDTFDALATIAAQRGLDDREIRATIASARRVAS